MKKEIILKIRDKEDFEEFPGRCIPEIGFINKNTKISPEQYAEVLKKLEEITEILIKR